MSCKYKLYLAHEQSADSDPVIIPYMVINRRFTALYGIITGSLSAYYSCARYITTGNSKPRNFSDEVEEQYNSIRTGHIESGKTKVYERKTAGSKRILTGIVREDRNFSYISAFFSFTHVLFFRGTFQFSNRYQVQIKITMLESF